MPVANQDHGTPAPAVLCQADTVEIGMSGAGTDPFDATLVLSGTDLVGAEVSVWTRLTPTAIYQLTEELDDVLRAQQQALGLSGDNPTDHEKETGTSDADEQHQGEGRVKRFFDPMGLRHLKDRSPRSTVILGAAIAALVVLTFILQLVR